MELFLNFGWALIAIAIVCLWLRPEPSRSIDRRTQLIALVMLIVILFPVISVSDDLWSLQNPAETDTCQRRNHLAHCPHSIAPANAILPGSAPAEQIYGVQRLPAAILIRLQIFENPALDPIQSRPPPVA
jgi:hypothetical protein